MTFRFEIEVMNTKLEAIAAKASEDLIALVKDGEEKILEAWQAAEEEGQLNESPPKLKLSLSITLDLKTVGNGAIQITPKVSAAVPEPKPDTTLLWATVEGNLVVDNPSQQKLDLRQVETRPTELRTAG